MNVPMFVWVHTNWRKTGKNDCKDFYHHLGVMTLERKTIKTTKEEFEKLIEGQLEETEQLMKCL